MTTTVEDFNECGFYPMGHLTLVIDREAFPENPREDDNLGIMYCEHGKYNLGDKNGKAELIKAIQNSEKFDASLHETYDITHPGDLVALATECGLLLLPLYLYDHSGITMSTTEFSCPWDSGQVGIIFVPPERLKDKSWVSLDTDVSEILEFLRNEVATYDKFISGQVYAWQLNDADDNIIESCGGYYEFDHMREDIKTAINNISLGDYHTETSLLDTEWFRIVNHKTDTFPTPRVMLYTPHMDEANSYRIVDKEFVKVCTDATHWAPITPPTN